MCYFIRHVYVSTAIIVILSISSTQAAIRPSFEFDYSVCKATHIVLATEGQSIDGRLKVLESWKGDMSPGSTILLPELAEFADEQQRRIHWWGLDDLPEPYVRFVTGSRMMLFLVKNSDQQNLDKPVVNNKAWQSAAYFGGLKVSAVWIEHGEAYAYRQTVNPGPSLLEHFGTAIRMKARVAAYVTICTDLEAAIKETNPVHAAQTFSAFLDSDFHKGARVSLDAIGNMGECSLPTLRRLLSDVTLRHLHDEIIATMVRAGGSIVTPDLLKIVNKELDYWSRQAPDLTVGWWNADPANQRKLLREHYSKLLEALRQLQVIGCNEECKNVVTNTLKLWKTTPALHDIGDGQMARTCAALLEKVSSDRAD